jgi:hypothetical protein
MRIQPRQQLLEVWRALGDSTLDDDGDWIWGGRHGRNSITDAEQLLCLLVLDRGTAPHQPASLLRRRPAGGRRTGGTRPAGPDHPPPVERRPGDATARPGFRLLPEFQDDHDVGGPGLHRLLADARGREHDRLSNAIRFVRTAVVDPNVAELAGLRAARLVDDALWEGL